MTQPRPRASCASTAATPRCAPPRRACAWPPTMRAGSRRLARHRRRRRHRRPARAALAARAPHARRLELVARRRRERRHRRRRERARPPVLGAAPGALPARRVGERGDAARRPHQGRCLPRPRRPRWPRPRRRRSALRCWRSACARGQGLDELRARLAGSTAVLLGRSGAGKSTLVNALVGADVAATAEVRRDGKGRHTTTHRELHLLAGGGVLIDTPGLRARPPARCRAWPPSARSATSRSSPRRLPLRRLRPRRRARLRRGGGGRRRASSRESASGPGSGPSAIASRSSGARTRPRCSEQRRHHRSLNRSLRAARKKHWI